jgi:DNA-binding NarL/FixJ family response regulator
MHTSHPRLAALWLIEDDEPYRNTIARLINNTEGMECTLAVSSCEEMMGALKGGDLPDVVLMDIVLPGMSGIEGVRRIRDASLSTPVIMLTIYQDDDKVFNAICAGASGYLLKSSPTQDVIQSIKTVLGGGSPINAHIARKVLDKFSEKNAPTRDYGLTQREREVLHLLVEGHSMKQVAEKLFVEVSTIDTHVSNIYGKLQVHTRASAVSKAVREKL